MATSNIEIDQWVGTLVGLLTPINRELTTEDFTQVVKLSGGLLATALQDLHRIADALEGLANNQPKQF